MGKRSRLWIALLVFAAVCAGAGIGGRWWWRTHVDPGRSPHVASLNLYTGFVDLTRITFSVGGAQNAPWTTTVDDFRRNRPLWELLDLANWNTVPEPLRNEALEQLLMLYRPLLMNPRVWDQMTTIDWDAVPQPIRTVAYRQMVAYWAGFYAVGGREGIDPGEIRDTLAAITMSESWFDHRAERVDETGNHDIGLVQASDFARDRLRQLARQGVVDVSLTDEDYWNPWKATRFLAIWMSLLLSEADGDLDRAVGAYNRGIASAEDPVGVAYLAAVQRRRRRFIRNQDAPPAWSWLWRRSGQIEAEEWPWLHGGVFQGDAHVVVQQPEARPTPPTPEHRKPRPRTPRAR